MNRPTPILALLRLAVMVTQSAVTSTRGQCVDNCTTAFATAVMSITHNSADKTSRLFAPFHAIVVSSQSNVVAQRKIDWMCYSIKKFDACVKRCDESRAKTLRLTTIQQWKTICAASSDSPKAFAEFVGCERKHYEHAATVCPSMQLSLDITLNSFCSQLHDYSACYSKVPFQCSEAATEIWLRINHSIMRSYNLLLELSSEHLKLPYKCQWAVSMSPSVYVGEDESPPTTTPVHGPMATTLSEVDDSEELFSDASADYWGDVEENRSHGSRKAPGESAESGSREDHVASSGRRDLATVQPPGELDDDDEARSRSTETKSSTSHGSSERHRDPAGHLPLNASSASSSLALYGTFYVLVCCLYSLRPTRHI